MGINVKCLDFEASIKQKRQGNPLGKSPAVNKDNEAHRSMITLPKTCNLFATKEPLFIMAIEWDESLVNPGQKGKHTGIRIEQSGFVPLPGLLRCVLGQDTLFSKVPLSTRKVPLTTQVYK